MATATLEITLNTPISELRPVTTDRILVIEDDAALRRILRRLFSAEGYEVDVVPDIVRGLEILRQRVSGAVVLDLPSPGSLGREICKKIANLIPGLPLVILSATQTLRTRSFCWRAILRIRHTFSPYTAWAISLCRNAVCRV